MALTLAKFMISNRCNKFSPLRYFKNVANKHAKVQCLAMSSKNYSTSIEPQIDKFIPLSSRTLFKRLMEENEKAGGSGGFEKFAFDVENTISKKNLNIVPELKFLYSPLDPDSPSLGDLSSHEIQDRHFWFMHHLTSLLTSAGFEEIKGAREKMKGGVVGQGVVVDCNIERFDIFKIFVMGGQNDPHSTSTTTNNPNSTTSTTQSFFSDKLFSKAAFWQHPKRVVVVRRGVGGTKVDVRMFKGVNSPSLLLPPSGSLKMHTTYKNILLTSSSLSIFFLLSRPSLLWLLGTDHLGNAPITLAGFFGGLSMLLWGGFKHAQKHHLERVVAVMYEGVVARNMDCLKMLVDKSQEELLKGVLLSYHFLNMNSQKPENELMSVGDLEGQVEEWTKAECGGLVVRVPLENTLKWMSLAQLIAQDPQTHKITLSPPSHLPNPPHDTHLFHSPLSDTHLFHNPLSDTNNPTPLSTTLMQNVRRVKGTA